MTALLHGLLRLLPSAFRRRFEDELREQIRLELEAARRRGRLAVLSVGLVTALDLLRTALAERWRPSFPRTGGPAGPRETTMQWTGWTRDLKQAVRGLTRARGFTTVAVVTLAVAIGANVGIFSVIDAVLLRPLPFPEPDELVYVAASAPGSDLPDEFGVAAEFYVQYAEEARTLESVALYSSFTATLQVDDRAERVRMSAPTTSLFTTLRVPPLLGRLPTPEEEDRVVLISHALWTSWFGADPGVLGRRITAAGADRTIIGVMGPEFWFPHEETLLWFPTTIEPTGITPGRFGAPMVARLAPGVTEAAVLDELGRLAQRLPDRFGGSSAYTDIIARHQPVLRPLKAELVGDASRPLWILLGAVAIVLLIACANVA
ncbi:MAG: ABC transporter permease, partial [Gemmatimonadetes bacterium]|nr:ABC transporter permease [Gemmatimonadota bacterium]